MFIFCLISNYSNSRAYSEPSQTSTMELFGKIVKDFQLLTILIKISILDIRLGFEYVSLKREFFRVLCFFKFIQFVRLRKQGKLIVIRTKSKKQRNSQQITEVYKKFNTRPSFTKVQGASESTFMLFFFKFYIVLFFFIFEILSIVSGHSKNLIKLKFET